MDPNWKQFVVVEFVETLEVATVLQSWIKKNEESGELECLWPDQANSVRKALIANKKPLPTWSTWRIRVLTSCDNFREALLKEKRAQDTSDLTSCAESDHGKLRKIRKPKRLLSDSSESGSEDIPSPHLKKTHESFPTNFNPHFSTTPTSSSSIFKTSISSRGSLLSSAETLSSPKTHGACNHDSAYLKLQEQQEKMERTIQLMRLEVREVLDLVSQMAKNPAHSKVLASIENDAIKTNFSRKFPIKSLEQFLELEDSLKNEETANLMIEFFTRVGGNTIDDGIKRTLVRLLTNEVAVHFSWEGRKGKRALNQMSLMKIVEKVISATFAEFTIKAFETRVREWFRQAGTRMYNKHKKNPV